MRAPSTASYHHRNQPSLEPILHRTTERRCFCGMLVAATTDPRRAALSRVPWLAVSDPKAISALHTRKGSNRPGSHQASPESATLRSLSERLTPVTAVTGILLRHGRLRAERNEPPWYSSRNPKVPPLYPSVHRENPTRLIGPDPPSYSARACFVSGATT